MWASGGRDWVIVVANVDYEIVNKRPEKGEGCYLRPSRAGSMLR